MKPKPQRYSNLTKEIAKCKPSVIMEIGTYDGKHGSEMIREAQKYNKDITYLGFDLFEDITGEEIVEEHSKKVKAVYEKAKHLLEKNKANIKLYRGYSKDTLAKLSNLLVDFVFIDGGHSLQTIAEDWKNVQRFIHLDSVIIFDDYYKNRMDFGCKPLIEELAKNDTFKIEHLEPEDVFYHKDWTQYVHFVKVTWAVRND